jgi:integrase
MVGKAKGKHKSNRLTAAHLRSPKPGRLQDGGGLFLDVDPSGAARWVQRLMVRGRRRDIGVGPLSVITLAEAREIASANRKLARAGGDPIAENRARRAADEAPTFEDAAQRCYDARADAWRNDKHKAQWLSSLKAYAFPKIGRMRVNDITTADVLDVLTPIWTTKAETALRVRQRLGLVLDWSKAKGWRETASPTRELGKALPSRVRTKRHQPAMPYADVPAFLTNLRETGAAASTKAAMELLILTAARTSEILQARWSEFDLAKGVWTVPADRMKARRAHAVPLSTRALVILSAMKEAHSGKGDFVFEAKPGKALSQMALLQVMRRLELAYVPHGFRSSFRDFAAEKTSAPKVVALASRIKA